MKISRLLRKSFGVRITLTFLTIFTIVFISAGLFISNQVRQKTLSHMKGFLADQNALLINVLKPFLSDGSDRKDIQQTVEKMGKNYGFRITFVDPKGLVLGDSKRTWEELLQMDNHITRPEIREAVEKGTGSSIRLSKTVGIEMLYVATKIDSEGKVLGIMRTSLPLLQVQTTLMSVQKPILFGLLVGILCVLGAGLFFGGYVTTRVREMTEAAIRYSRGDIDKKIHINSNDELRVLADSMNHMVSTLKERIAESENQRATAAAILQNMTEGLIAVNRNNEILMSNASAARIMGRKDNGVVGKTLVEISRHPQLDEMVRQAVKSGGLVSGEIELAEPTQRIIRVNAVGMGKQGSSSIEGVIVLHDVTDIRKLEKMRRDFVANVSHELKTPLTSIKGFIETLQNGAVKDPEKSMSFLGMMEEDTERLSRLIHDLLELSMIETKELPLRIAPANLTDEVETVLKTLTPVLKEKNISVIKKYQSGRWPEVLIDRDKIKQVLMNLLDNAAKFSEGSGTIEIEFIKQPDHLKVEIQDTGIGIPSDDVDRVFERFYRVDKARSRALGGTGLGLSIVKHIIEAHSGRVGCTSVLGQGSTFYFTLPLK